MLLVIVIILVVLILVLKVVWVVEVVKPSEFVIICGSLSDIDPGLGQVGKQA